MKTIKIGNKEISETSKPFIIAEAGVNYYEIAEKEKIDLLTAAKKMIEEAALNGADAIKFQSYKAEKLSSKNSPAYWDNKKEKTKTQYELFKKYDKFGESEYKILAEYAKKNNITFLSTPFDIESVDYLDKLVPAFKVASADITNKPFLEYIASKGKPMILSTGASTIEEIQEALKWIKNVSNVDVAILHCVLSYPTKNDDANLHMIKSLSEHFPKNIVGYSDHTLPSKEMTILTTAYLLGARIIEKHFTLDKSLPGNDHYHAMDPADLRILKENISFIYKIVNFGQEKKVIPCEEGARMYARRSLVATRKISKGEVISKSDITWKRPGTGIPPKFIDRVVGGKALDDINEDEILTFNKIKLK